MKNTSLFALIILVVLTSGCPKENPIVSDEFIIDGQTFAIDTILISTEATDIEIPITYFDSSKIDFTAVPILATDEVTMEFLRQSAELNTVIATEPEKFSDSNFLDQWRSFQPQMEFLSSTYNFDVNQLDLECINNKPTEIEDLTAGLSLRAYKFDKDNQSSLGLFGFANIELGRKENVVLVEFLQTGNHTCEGKTTKYGIGARMMMRITSKKRRAKISSPQQISASVTFGLAEVEFSMITVGITGPGTANLVNQGSMTENTYTNFLKAVSGLIVDVYKDDSAFFIDPQLLPVKE